MSALLEQAADAAQALLDTVDGGTVVRDEAEVYATEDVFVFNRTPAPLDDQLLVVEKDTGHAYLMPAPPWEEHPFPGLVPVVDEDESESGPIRIV